LERSATPLRRDSKMVARRQKCIAADVVRF
jgi:hypothetical protein